MVLELARLHGGSLQGRDHVGRQRVVVYVEGERGAAGRAHHAQVSTRLCLREEHHVSHVKDARHADKVLQHVLLGRLQG